MSDHKHDHDHEHCDHEHCDHDHEMEEEWIVLVDDEGTEYRYAFERLIEMDDKKYYILVPENQDESGEMEEAHVFRLDTDADGNEILVDIDDQEMEKIEELLENEDDDEWEEIDDEDDEDSEE